MNGLNFPSSAQRGVRGQDERLQDEGGASYRWRHVPSPLQHRRPPRHRRLAHQGIRHTRQKPGQRAIYVTAFNLQLFTTNKQDVQRTVRHTRQKPGQLAIHVTPVNLQNKQTMFIGLFITPAKNVSGLNVATVKIQVNGLCVIHVKRSVSELFVTPVKCRVSRLCHTRKNVF